MAVKSGPKQIFCNALVSIAAALVCLAVIIAGLYGFVLLVYHPTTDAPNIAENIKTDEAQKENTDVIWTKYSDGNDWNRASDAAKRDLCYHLSDYSRHGVSADVFFDALNESYNTTDAKILNVSLEFTCQYIEESRR
jgi:hypothetical protein